MSFICFTLSGYFLGVFLNALKISLVSIIIIKIIIIFFKIKYFSLSLLSVNDTIEVLSPFYKIPCETALHWFIFDMKLP